MKIVFFGTSSIGADVLHMLHQVFSVVQVVTQPEQKKYRGLKRNPTPIAEVAYTLPIPVIYDYKFLSPKADLGVVFSYGRLLPQSVLKHFPMGCINIHPSLLPAYRGSSPVEYTLLYGGTGGTGIITGLSIIQMVEAMDAGPVLHKHIFSVPSNINRVELIHIFQLIAPIVLREYLLNTGHYTPQDQDESKVTYTKKITKQDYILNPKESIDILERKIRAYYPNATLIDRTGKRLKILFAKQVSVSQMDIEKHAYIHDSLHALQLLYVQPESGKAMRMDSYLRGHTFKL